MLQVFLHVYVPKFRVCLINCMCYQFEHFFSCSVSLTAYENILWIWYNQMTSSIYRLLYKKTPFDIHKSIFFYTFIKKMLRFSLPCTIDYTRLVQLHGELHGKQKLWRNTYKTREFPLLQVLVHVHLQMLNLSIFWIRKTYCAYK